ncbi:MAG: hypothetical protein H6698_05085 [Myxococcales bacterium]|nr:hypothetical protein [Myxococcales bacterium]MCB9530429.1 hypothetical protein [Myxococcales bacterium]MCB9533676.1 hypothetical protein [Myxococcales bacterium]
MFPTINSLALLMLAAAATDATAADDAAERGADAEAPVVAQADEPAADADPTADDPAQVAEDAADGDGDEAPALSDSVIAIIEEPTDVPDVAADGERERLNYREWWMAEAERIGDMDLYGVSAQLPRGYMKAKWDYGWLQADARFNTYGHRGPVLQPLRFDADINGDGVEERIVDVDLGVGGHGHGHTFQFSYGITDPLDFYVEIPFTAMELNLRPQVRAINDAGDTIDPTVAGLLGVDPQNFHESELLYQAFPALGRPGPATGYDGDWLLGDINAGFSWNPYRTRLFSTAWTNRVYFPTGHIPAPESSLTYATGPQPEIGIGGWGIGTTTGYDLKLCQFGYWFGAVLSTEFGMSYFFKQERPYPTNFVTPSPAAAAIDARQFPDLSDLEGTFEYTPGIGTTWNSQLNMSFLIFGLGVGYGVRHSQEPILKGDDGFVGMVDSFELLGAQTTQELQLGASVVLLPVYIPARLGISRRIIVGGRDTLVYSNFWQFTLESFAPVSQLWERGRHR